MKKTSIIYSISKEELQQIINESKTYGQVLKHFGLENRSGNPQTLKRRIKDEMLDDSCIIKHLKFGGGWNKGQKGIHSQRMPLEEAMEKIFTINSGEFGRAKKYVRAYNLIEEKCKECGISKEWNGKPITIELDHIDGNSHNNLLSNLRWLCPNCHSQTPTFKGRKNKIAHLCKCGTPIRRDSSLCKRCEMARRASILKIDGGSKKVEWPSREELRLLIQQTSLTQIGKSYGVSGNAVKKWCKTYGISHKKLEPEIGVEPTTSAVQVLRSAN